MAEAARSIPQVEVSKSGDPVDLVRLELSLRYKKLYDRIACHVKPQIAVFSVKIKAFRFREITEPNCGSRIRPSTPQVNAWGERIVLNHADLALGKVLGSAVAVPAHTAEHVSNSFISS